MKFLTPEEYLDNQERKLQKLRGTGGMGMPTVGVIKKVLLPPAVLPTKENRGTYSVTCPVSALEIDIRGIFGERHYGETALAGPRTTNLYKSGSAIRNNRQILAVSEYDCRQISQRMGVEVTPELLGVNMVIEREDGHDYSLTDLPPDLYLAITSPEQDSYKHPLAVLGRYSEQQGCPITGLSVTQSFGNDELKKSFQKSAKTNRGVLFRVDFPVEPSAILQPGMKVFFLYAEGVTI